jgi:hypothetical protein
LDLFAAENEAPSLLRLKAVQFLSIAGSTKSPVIAAEARQIAERCVARALELEDQAKRRRA